MFIDQTLSIIWSFFFWISSALFIYSMVYFALGGNLERIYHMLTMAFLFVCFEMISGTFQLIASLIVDDRGRKVKYLLFAPLYMLFYWMMNALTIVTTFIPAVKTILGLDSETWKSPERKGIKDTVNNYV